MDESYSDTPWRFRRFGLIVTRAGEREFLADLLNRTLSAGDCNFRVITKVGQRGAVTSPKRQARMTGTGSRIPNKDAQEIGFPARRFLGEHADSFVILVDDLEFDRKDDASLVFNRYRTALDIGALQQKHRAAVHFLVYMLEAYYFAHAAAMNAVLGLSEEDYSGDVETIRHPKNDLKQRYAGFDERSHGLEIVKQLDLRHVLARVATCRSLRTLIAWCVRALRRPFSDEFQLLHGEFSPVTKAQIDKLGS